jgi:AcrR family transcriptional regulator
MSQTRQKNALGRRSEVREQAIFTAVLELLQERGYKSLTMDAVAAQAQASKATLYRHWAGKPELVTAALDAYTGAHVLTIADTGNLRGDLLAAMEALRQQASEQNLALIYDLVHAMRYDSKLATVMKEHILNDNLPPFAPVLQRAIARGELPTQANLTLIHEVGEALVFRQHSLGLPFDQPFILHVIDDVLLLLLQPVSKENN